MIEITLKELNESYGQLVRVAGCITGAPLKFRLLPVVRYAKQAVEDMNQQIGEIAGRHGAQVYSDGRFDFAILPEGKTRNDAVALFEREYGRLMRAETVKFNTDKSKYLLSDIQKCESKDSPTNAADLGFLDWLFTWDMDEAKEEEKAQAASA